MKSTLILKAGLAVLTLAVFAAAAGQTDKSKDFNGLGMSLGNLSRLSKAKTRSISPENFTGEKGKAGMATEGTGARVPPATWARAGRSRPPSRIEPQADVHAGRHRGPGRDPADLDDARPAHWRFTHPAHLLGRRGAAVGRVPGRRLLRLRLGQVRAGLVAAGLRQSRAAPSTATGRCRSASAAGSR